MKQTDDTRLQKWDMRITISNKYGKVFESTDKTAIQLFKLDLAKPAFRMKTGENTNRYDSNTDTYETPLQEG